MIYHWLIMAAVALFLNALSSAPADSAEEIPIWWAPDIGLDSLEAVPNYLERPFFKNDSKGLPLRKREGGRSVEARAINCRDFSRLTGEGFYDVNPIRYFAAVMKDFCEVARRLKEARPARASFVTSFRFDEAAPDYLPAMLDLGGSCEYACRLHIANAHRIPWSEFDTIEQVEAKGDHEVEIITAGSQNTVKLMARADFNGDGLEDLLVRTTGSARGGTLSASSLYVLSRDADDSVLFVLGPGAYLCPTYTCERQYGSPSALRGLELP